MKQKGFTLIELIVVIVIIGILVSFTMEIITAPIISYYNQQSRNTLADNAEMALQQIERDIRQSLPNSVRVSSDGLAIEMLHVNDGGRYRSKQTATGSGDILDFTTSDTSFDVIGSLIQKPTGYLVIYNLGDSLADAYSGNNRTAVNALSTLNNVIFSAKQFPQTSPNQRFFIVDTPITYTCDLNSGHLKRYYGYAIAPAINVNPGGTGDIQANKISSCYFSYNAGRSTSSGVVEMQLSLKGDGGESISLMYEVHVDNAP